MSCLQQFVTVVDKSSWLEHLWSKRQPYFIVQMEAGVSYLEPRLLEAGVTIFWLIWKGTGFMENNIARISLHEYSPSALL